MRLSAENIGSVTFIAGDHAIGSYGVVRYISNLKQIIPRQID